MKTEFPEMVRATFEQIFSDDVSGIKQQLTEVQESLSFFNKMFEELRKENNDLKKTHNADIKLLKDENKILKESVKNCELRLKSLEEEKSRQQQWSRLQNIELVGVPESNNEVTAEVAMKVIKHIGVQIDKEDIEFAHRVQPRRATSAKRGRAIVIRLKSRKNKDQIIAAARKKHNVTAKDVGLGEISNKIYINEHLTTENKIFLSSCKQKAKEVNFKYTWTKNCRIYVRKSDTSPPIPISCAADVARMV